MPSANKCAFFGNLVLEVCQNVYEPAEDSYLFAENIKTKPGSKILDLGTGTGILAIVAAAQEGDVMAVDLNPYAIRCAKRNAIRNGLARNMAFLQGDLFDPIRETERFDLLLFNSPYLPTGQGETNSWTELAWAGGPSGRQVIDRFIFQVPSRLRLGGKVLLMQSNLADIEETIRLFHQIKMNVEIQASLEVGFFEKIVLVKAWSM
jgi:release factor glutamine methyltransferase